jgi:hypothetical protein
MLRLAKKSLMYWAQASKAVDSGLSPLTGSFRDRSHVPVANDSCGGAAAVVNYRNWPLIGLAVPSGVSVGAVETTRVGRQRKK